MQIKNLIHFLKKINILLPIVVEEFWLKHIYKTNMFFCTVLTYLFSVLLKSQKIQNISVSMITILKRYIHKCQIIYISKQNLNIKNIIKKLF